MLDPELQQLTTFVMGPEPSGGGSGILRASSNLPGSSIGSLPVVLLEWNKHRLEEQTYICYPTNTGVYIAKFQYITEGSSGPVGFAHGVYVTNEQLERLDYQTHKIAAVLRETIPIPENRTYDNAIRLDFASRPLSVNRAQLTHQFPADEKINVPKGVTLATENQRVTPYNKEIDSFETLSAILDSMDSEQRKNSNNWIAGIILDSRSNMIIRPKLLVSRNNRNDIQRIETGLELTPDGDLSWSGPLTEETELNRSYKVYAEMVSSKPQYAAVLEILYTTQDMEEMNDLEVFEKFLEQSTHARLPYTDYIELLCDGMKSENQFLRGASTIIAKRYIEALFDHFDKSQSNRIYSELIDTFSKHLDDSDRRDLIINKINEVFGVIKTPEQISGTHFDQNPK